MQNTMRILHGMKEKIDRMVSLIEEGHRVGHYDFAQLASDTVHAAAANQREQEPYR